jgi:hypothetical protein
MAAVALQRKGQICTIGRDALLPVEEQSAIAEETEWLVACRREIAVTRIYLWFAAKSA